MKTNREKWVEAGADSPWGTVDYSHELARDGGEDLAGIFWAGTPSHGGLAIFGHGRRLDKGGDQAASRQSYVFDWRKRGGPVWFEEDAAWALAVDAIPALRSFYAEKWKKTRYADVVLVTLERSYPNYVRVSA